MAMKAVHMTARGRVQGVGFRFFVRERSVSYGIKGWIRNRPDGSVEIHAEGDKGKLSQFIANVREGPVFGHVSELLVEWIEPEQTYLGFNIVF